ncbi:MAG: phosphoribosylamine--glycine ligase [Pyrinomonadaceae bacterium]
MKILVVGSGGREHAICRSLKKSAKVEKIYCADGNAGIAEIAERVAVKPTDIQSLADFAAGEKIDLTFVGGETPLALGIVDEFEKRGLKIVGANRRTAQLEASKSFAKDFMARHKIPTAAYETASSIAEAKKILQSGKFGDENAPVVVKADGLAAGKGVVVAADKNEARRAIDELENLVGKRAVEKIVLEECLFGREVSLIMFADGANFALMPPVRDHKRIYENDRGANTGGMGTICDDCLLSPDETKEIVEKIIKPTLAGARAENFPFRGILFLGLMMTERGAQVLEYNARFGDPETQSILIRLETDLTEICEAILNKTLDKIAVKWKRGSSACVILAAENYPQKPKTGDVIKGLDEIKPDKNVFVFHSGTAKNEDGEFVTAGGRVLGVTALGNDINRALSRAYRAAGKISFDGMQFRQDIGK